MTNINIDIDTDLYQAWKKHLAGKNIKDAIPELMKKDLGWTEDFYENKISQNKEVIENLTLENKELEEKLRLRLREKVNYLKMNYDKSRKVRSPSWKGNYDIVHAHAEAGITYNDLFVLWEEI